MMFTPRRVQDRVREIIPTIHFRAPTPNRRKPVG